jgi:hypothetical protein
MNIMSKALALVGCVLLGASAQAAIVTYNFAGTTDYSSVAGTAATFTGTFSYDAAIPASYNGTDSGGVWTVYTATAGHGFSLALQSGSVAAAGASKPGSSLEVYNSTPGHPGDSFGATLTNGYNTFTGGANGGYISFRDANGSAFSSTALPTSLDLLAFTDAKINLSFANYLYSYQGSITSLSLTASSAAPEPASWGMMITGFGAIGGALRRRKSTAAIA